MRKIILGVCLLLLFIIVGYLFWRVKNFDPMNTSPPQEKISIKKPSGITILAQNLDTPWAIAFLSDKSMFVTERPGRVRLVDKNGKLDPTPVANVSSVKEIGEGGLLGITLHPDFAKNKYVYLYYTYDNQDGNTRNRVVRMVYKDKKLTGEKIIVDTIPGALNHNGGRIKFGPDGFLYISTGDAQEPSQSQDTRSLAGKILRVSDEGKPADGNPFANEVYSYGHRNSQGIAWDGDGQLWSTEHGRSGVQSGLDEINRIEKGANYGWPLIQGDEKRVEMKTPVAHSGAFSTWAPGSAAIMDENLFFGGLRGNALYKAVIKNDRMNVSEYFKGTYGRIREVIVGPDRMLYITTSNMDGRGLPKEGDDKIFRIDPSKL